MTALIATLIALGLIVATSLLTYEILRFAWRHMWLSAATRGRVLYAIAAAFVAHIASITVYAVAYYLVAFGTMLGSLEDATPGAIIEPLSMFLCFYFSAATYSSLGFGDIVPTGALRLVAVMEGLNGLTLIGWSVAYSFLAMEEFWEKPKRPEGA